MERLGKHNIYATVIRGTIRAPDKPAVRQINSFGQRSDQGLDVDWEKFWQSLCQGAIPEIERNLGTQDGRREFVVTSNISPHTPVTLSDEKGNTRPAHLLIWVKNYHPSLGTIPGVASLTDEQIVKMPNYVTAAIEYLSRFLGDSKSIFVYFMGGFTDRGNLIFSNACQSNPYFHLHLSVLKKGENDFQEDFLEPTFVERLKYHGIFNQEIFDLFDKLTKKIIQQEDLPEKDSISLESTAEGALRISFNDSNGDPIDRYLWKLRYLARAYEDFYQKLLGFYKKLILEGKWSSFSSQDLINFFEGEGFDVDFYSKLTEILKATMPSKRFIIDLIKDPNNRDHIQNLVKFLKRLKNKRRQVADSNIKIGIERFFSFTSEEVEFFLFVMSEVLEKKGFNRPNLLLPQRFSWAAIFSSIRENSDGKLVFDYVDVRPMFMTAGGNVAEKISGSIIRRSSV